MAQLVEMMQPVQNDYTSSNDFTVSYNQFKMTQLI